MTATTTSRFRSCASTKFRRADRPKSSGTAELPLPPLLEPRRCLTATGSCGSACQRPQPHLSRHRHRDRGDGRAENPVDRYTRRPAYLKRFLMEEWIARRIDSPPRPEAPLALQTAQLSLCRHRVHRGADTAAMDAGQSTPRPRDCPGIVEQIATGLRAFHRMEMLRRDLRPDNVLIDKTGTAKIIDFGSVKVAGVIEATRGRAPESLARGVAPHRNLLRRRRLAALGHVLAGRPFATRC